MTISVERCRMWCTTSRGAPLNCPHGVHTFEARLPNFVHPRPPVLLTAAPTKPWVDQSSIRTKAFISQVSLARPECPVGPQKPRGDHRKNLTPISKAERRRWPSSYLGGITKKRTIAVVVPLADRTPPLLGAGITSRFMPIVSYNSTDVKS